MKNKKLCCRIYPVILIVLSAILSAALWYFDEGIHDFLFLKDKGEFFNYAGTVLFVSIVPIGLFYYLVEKERFESRARPLSLLGFLPALLFLVFTLVK